MQCEVNEIVADADINIEGIKQQFYDQGNESDPDAVSTHFNPTVSTLGHEKDPFIKTELTEESDSNQDEYFEPNCDIEMGKCNEPNSEVPKVDVETVYVKSEILESCDSDMPSCDEEEDDCKLDILRRGGDDFDPNSCEKDVKNETGQTSERVRERKFKKPLAKVINGRKTFCCQNCPYKTTSSSHMRNHMFTHSGKKPYNCTVCSFSCSRASNLKRHMATHTGHKPFKCPQCSHSCSQAGHLKIHMASHTIPHKPYKCTVCSYRCRERGNLKRHMTTHVVLKCYRCIHCAYSCIHAHELKIHMVTHIGHKPYVCSQCSCSYFRAYDLKRHVAAAHVREKPFKCTKCPLCPYIGSWAGSLKRHMVTHSIEKPYGCAHCEHRTSGREYLIKHLASKHKDIMCPR